MAPLTVLLSRDLAAEEAHRILATELAPRYTVQRVPGRNDELYVSRPPWTYILIKLRVLPDGRTGLRVSADAFAHPFQWLYGRLIGSKQVARAITRALN